MVKIKRQIVSNSIINNTSNGRNNPVNYLVIHETANTSAGANAAMHARLQSNGNSRAASWHYTCGSDGIYQSFPDDVKCWHAGSSYNDNSIGIEIAVNSDGNYKKAVKNAAGLVKHLMKKHNVAKSNIITHKKASTWNKPCPANMLDGSKGVTWADFLKMIDGSSGKASTGSNKKKSKSSDESLGLVDWMNSKGKDSSFSNREKLAKQYGIKNYKGTASQNNKLLSKLKSGDKPKKKKKKKGNPKGLGLVDWLDSQNRNSSFSAREKLANQNGINNYKGTASQNTKLLKKLTGGGSKKKKGKSIKKMAEEVLAGKHGSGHANRRKSLGISKKKYKKVRKKVNQLASSGSSGGKSVKQIAKEIVNGKGIPQGHEARRNHFGISKKKYEKVRKKVNQML